MVPESERSILVLAEKITDRFAVNLCDPLQLDNVQAAFAKLTLRDEGMRFPKTPRYLLLEITSVVPRFYQAFQEGLIGSLVCRIAFVHKLRLRERASNPQNREWDSGKLHISREGLRILTHRRRYE